MTNSLLETFEALEEGLVYRCTNELGMTVAAGSRTALLNDGTVVCTFMVQSELGSNDFKPMLCRSEDGGSTWTGHRLIWPHLKNEWSIFGSVSSDSYGNLYFFGTRTPIDSPGESFWCDLTQGMKQNELIWSRSEDDGRTWSEPMVIAMPISGSAEAAGPMCITQSGRWICCYCPYRTLDTELEVDTNQVVALTSDNEGNSWSHTSMLRFKKQDSGSAEAWVIQLKDGRLLGTCWHVNHEPSGQDLPNAYAISCDEGDTWTVTRSTSIYGQAAAMAPIADGSVAFVYNNRKQQPAGVWLAEANPSDSNFGITTQKLLWEAPQATRSGSNGNHDAWTDFAFGEPSVTVLSDGSLLVSMWCIHTEGSDIRYLQLPSPMK